MSQTIYIKETNPKWDIPNITNDTSLYDIHTIYQGYIKGMEIVPILNRNKTYLILIWSAIECITVKLGIRTSGYATKQILLMSKYTPLLTKLTKVNIWATLKIWIYIIYLSIVDCIKMAYKNSEHYYAY
jgi:hypothetical protein